MDLLIYLQKHLMNLKKKEIMKNKEYSVIKNLSVAELAIATSSVSYASAIHPQKINRYVENVAIMIP